MLLARVYWISIKVLTRLGRLGILGSRSRAMVSGESGCRPVGHVRISHHPFLCVCLPCACCVVESVPVLCQSCQPRFELHLMGWAMSPAFPCRRSPFGSETCMAMAVAGIGIGPSHPVKLHSSGRHIMPCKPCKQCIWSLDAVCAA